MKRRLVVAGCAALLLAASACGSRGEGGGASAEGDTLKLGAALSLTGSLAREGKLTQEGYEVCKQVVNEAGGIPVGGKKLKLEISYQDDKSQPDTAAQLVDQFNSKGYQLILGPYGSSATEAAAAVIERNGQIMVEGAGADNTIFSHGYKRTFGALSPATDYLGAIVQAIAEEADPKPKTIAILSADDGFSKTAAEGGVEVAKKQGLEIVAQEEFPAESTNVASQLTSVRSKNPDLVVVSAHVVEGIAVIRQAAELNLSPMGFAETVAPPTPDFTETLGDLANGVIGSSQWVSTVTGEDKYFGTGADYAKTFEAKYNRPPEYHNAEASAACLSYALAVEKAGSTEPDAIRDALGQLDTESFFGRLAFDDSGMNTYKTMSVIQVQDGKVVTVWPKDQAEAEMIWPAAKGG